MYTLDEYRSWILGHKDDRYTINNIDDTQIECVTEYGIGSINFTVFEETAITELKIISKKDDDIKFYLHFEISEEDHAKQLYDEFIEALIALENERTVRVLLSCSAGLTTSMFAMQLNDAAQTLGVDYEFEAVSYLSIYEAAGDFDAIMIAPQIGYMLNRLKDSITDKPVVQIPTAVFAAYDAMKCIEFIRDEFNAFNEAKTEVQAQECHCDVKEKVRILSIAIMPNKAQVRLYYNFYDQGEIVENNVIIKPSFSVQDLDDIVGAIKVKHQEIDMIGIASTGTVIDDAILDIRSINPLMIEEESEKYNLAKHMEETYSIKTVVLNNVNAAVLSFANEHPEYRNVAFLSQPFGFSVGGQGFAFDRKVIFGKNGVAGETRLYIRRMQLSDDPDRLGWTEEGALEIVTKSILATIGTVGPEAMALRSPMTPDMDAIKKKLSSWVNEDQMPEFYYIPEASNYMMDGAMRYCLERLREED